MLQAGLVTPTFINAHIYFERVLKSNKRFLKKITI